MGSTSPTQARTACRTSDFSMDGTLFAMVERFLPPKPGFAAEDERTRHPVAAETHPVAAARRLHGSGRSTAAGRDYPG